MAARVTLRPRSSDGNGQVMKKFCGVRDETASSLPRPVKPPSPCSRKKVVVKVEPSYISSDLFTPFSEPRSTLPSIGEFVRPSYSSDRTWGAVTSSYGGVGSACQLFKKSGRGSISRSHRHYGSGCVNYYEDELHAREPTYKDESAAVGAAPPRQHERISTISTKNVPLSVKTASALRNVCASLYGTSSYNSDFTSAHINTSTAPHHSNIMDQYSTHQTPIQRKIINLDSSDILTLQKGNIQPANNEESRCGKCEFCAEWGNHLQKKEGYKDQDDLDDSCSSCGSSGEEEDSCSSDDPEQTAPTLYITNTTHGHMISIPPCSLNILPSHVTVTSLSELPSHFRRVTAKYTRNRCPLLPCHVPHYLLRKHQLLPSIMAAPPFSRNGPGKQLPTMTKDAAAMTTMKCHKLSMSESPGEECATDKDRQLSTVAVQDAQLLAIAKDTAGNCHTNFDGSGEKTDKANNYNRLSYLVGSGQEAGRNGGGGKDAKSSTKSDQNGPRRHHKRHHHRHHGTSARKLTSKVKESSDIITIMQPEVKGHVRRHSHVLQHLGEKFKTQAHTRYHSLFPEQVPDLQAIEPSKRHTFFGYHTSVFRG